MRQLFSPLVIIPLFAAFSLGACATSSDNLSTNSAVTSDVAQPSNPSINESNEQVDSPQYQDEQPFAYNDPAGDGFYNSGYEESLYSPFAFN